MKDEGGFPKYQYSEFCKNGRDGQFVVRSNDKDEFKRLISEVDEFKDVLYSKQPVQQKIVSEDFPEDTPIEQPKDEAKMVCAIHGIPMRKMKGPYSTFFTHGEKMEDGSWRNCNGRGYKTT